MGSASSTPTPHVEKKALLIRYDTGDDAGIYEVKKALKNIFGFDDKNITMLYYDIEHSEGKYCNSGQEAPTADRFKQRFTELIQDAKPGDVRFLYVDAHGSTLPKTDQDRYEPGPDDEGGSSPRPTRE